MPYVEPQSSGKHLLTQDVAKAAGVSGTAVRIACATGRIVPAHTTPGGVHIYHHEALEGFIAAREQRMNLLGALKSVWRRSQ